MTLSGTIAETGATGSTTVTYQFDYGTSTAYGASTPPAATTVTATGATVTAPAERSRALHDLPLPAGRERLHDRGCQTESADQTFTTGTTLQPALGATVGVAPVSGQITVKLPGTHRFTKLAAGATSRSARPSTPATASCSSRERLGLVGRGGERPVLRRRLRGHPAPAEHRHGAGARQQLLGLPGAGARAARADRGHQEEEKAAAGTTRRRSSTRCSATRTGSSRPAATTRRPPTRAPAGGPRPLRRHAEIAVTAGKVSLTDLVHHRTFVLTAGHHYLAAASLTATSAATLARE